MIIHFCWRALPECLMRNSAYVSLLNAATASKGLTQVVNNEQLATRVIFLTANATDQNIFTLIENGASGLLLKDAAVAELVTCIKQVHAGSKYLPKELISAAIERETGKRIALRHIEELT